MSHGHFILKCKCGRIIAQCRCPASDKAIEVSNDPCPVCRIAGETKPLTEGP